MLRGLNLKTSGEINQNITFLLNYNEHALIPTTAVNFFRCLVNNLSSIIMMSRPIFARPNSHTRIIIKCIYQSRFK